MIAYLDSSSLVKLYEVEPGSSQVAKLISNVRQVATATIAYIEVNNVFCRKVQEGLWSKMTQRKIASQFESEWENFVRVEPTEPILRLAAKLAQKHRLKSLDLIHLSSAAWLALQMAEKVSFSCFDKILNRAAAKEGLILA